MDLSSAAFGAAGRSGGGFLGMVSSKWKQRSFFIYYCIAVYIVGSFVRQID